MRLRNEVALIQGGTRGMGRKMAERFAAEGASVVVTGRNAERGLEVEKAILNTGAHARFVRVDVCNEDEVKASVAEAVDTYGKLTVVVNVAGATEHAAGGSKIDGTVADITTEAWDKILGTDLRGTWLSCKYAIPEMIKAGKGSIVNLSSFAANQALAGVAAYSAAKAGVHALTRSVAVENAQHKIRCNCMMIGLVPNWQTAFFNEENWQRAFAACQPLGLGTEEDMAATALFLASDESRYITGSILTVDGGLSTIVHLPSTPAVGGDESFQATKTV